MTSLLATLGGALLGLTIAATLIWSVAGLLALLLRRHSAALRHRLWGLSFAAVLAAPAVAAWLPLPRGVEWIEPDATAVSVTEPVSLTDAVPFDTVTEPLERRGVEFTKTANPYQVPVLAESAWPPLAPANGPVEPAVPAERPVSATIPLTAEPETNLWPLVFGGFVAIWCVGLVLGGSLSLLSRWRLGRLLRRSLPVEHAPVLDLCRDLAARLKLRQPVQVLTSAETAVPFVTGIVQPALVLPAGFGTWTADRLQVVLAHELMHVRRGDVAWQWLAQTTLAATWFHPLAWVALWRLRVEREHACDDAVLLAGYQPADYATHLVEVAADLRLQRTRFAPAVAMASRSPVERRIRAILDATLPRGPAGRWRTAATMVGLALGLVVAAMLTPASSVAEGPEQDAAAAVLRGDETRSDGKTETSEVTTATEGKGLDQEVTFLLSGSLTEGLAKISDQIGMPIRLESQGFADAEINLEAPLSMGFSGMTARMAISQLIGSMQDSEKPVLPSIVVRSGVVVLSVGPDLVQQLNLAISDFAAFHSTETARGRVIDAQGQAIPRARIELRSHSSTTYFRGDGEGHFEIPAMISYFAPLSLIAKSEAGDQWGGSTFRPTGKGPTFPDSIDIRLASPRHLEVIVTSRGQRAEHVPTAILFADGRVESRLTNRQGRATFKVPTGEEFDSVAAWSPELGLDYVAFPPLESTETDSISLTLEGSAPGKLMLVDDAGQPVPGVRVSPVSLQKPGQSAGFPFPGQGRLFDATTNDAGEAEFRWLPSWRTYALNLTTYSPKFADGNFELPQADAGISVTATLRRPVEVRGQIRDATGAPVAHARVRATGAGFELQLSQASVFADHNGQYAIPLPPDQIYMLHATAPDGKRVQCLDGLPVRADSALSPIDLTLKTGTRVFGKVTVPKAYGSSSYRIVRLIQLGRDLKEIQIMPVKSDKVCPVLVLAIPVQRDGTYEIYLPPGNYEFQAAEDSGAQKVTITDQKEIEVNFEDGDGAAKATTGPSSAPVVAVAAASAPEATDRSGASIGAALDRKLTLSFKEVSLNDAFALLARESGVAIRLEWWRFLALGLDRDSPRTLEFDQVSLRQMIAELLTNRSPASNGIPGELRLIPLANVLQVTTTVGASKLDGPPDKTTSMTGDVEGVVLDNSGAPVPYASVQLDPLGAPTFLNTDSQGRFRVAPDALRRRPPIAFATNTQGDQQLWARLKSEEGVISITLKPVKRLKLQATSRGQPLGNAKAVVLFDDNRIQMARSLEDGMATVGIPAGRNVASLCMWREGHGFDYVVYPIPRSQTAAIPPLTPQPEGTVSFELNGGRDVAIQLLNETGAPLEGVTVYPWILEKPGQPDSMNFAQVQRQFQQVTDAEGWVRFDWLPDWNARPITFWALKAGFARGRIEADLTKVDQSPFTFTLRRLVEVSGEVVDSEGQPVPAANIIATGDGYVDDRGFGQTVSDEHGRFHLNLPPDQLYLVRVTSQDQLSAGSIDALVVRSGQPQPDVNIKLSAAIRVFGQLPPGPDQKPQAGATITIKHYGRDLQTLEKDSLPNPAGLRRKIQPSQSIDAKADQLGRFEVRLSPGEYEIRNIQSRTVHRVTITDQAEIELNFILDDNPDR